MGRRRAFKTFKKSSGRTPRIIYAESNKRKIQTMLARAAKQFSMWMPNMPMLMVSAKNATTRQPARAIFRVMPRMTKHEIKEYLTKIYGLPVTKVIRYKYKDFKRAVVSFDRSFKDVGKGMRIPE